MPTAQPDIIARLRREILPLQGLPSPIPGKALDLGWGPIDEAFPNGSFPTGAIHEFCWSSAEEAASTKGFVAGILSALMCQGGVCIWVSTGRALFPPSLSSFGIAPDRILFVDLKKEKDLLWVVEEALKCHGLAAVVGETGPISFIHSRRLQLAVEQSRVTGLMLCRQMRFTNITASVSRWKVSAVPSVAEDDLPGIGFPRWRVELNKIRNGKPGSWTIEWAAGRFRHLPQKMTDTASPGYHARRDQTALPIDPAQSAIIHGTEKRKTG